MEDINSMKRMGISPYDESFPVMLLSDAFNIQLDKAEKATVKIVEDVVRQTPAYFDTGVIEEDKIRIVVDATEEIKDIHEGRIKLVEENGAFFAQLRENGKYSKKLPVKEEVYNEGGDSGQIATAMQLKAIQESLIVISNQLNKIDERVREVITGQQNDRMGIYYSGVALYIESMYVTDLEMKKNLISQSIKALTEAVFKMTLMMQSDICYLKAEGYKKQKNKVGLIKERMDSINQGFSIVHQASLLKAGIYCKENELVAAGVVLEEYSKFIRGTVTNNAELLALCDITDTGTEYGRWRSRSKLELDVTELTKRLKTPEKVIYIDTRDGGRKDESI